MPSWKLTYEANLIALEILKGDGSSLKRNISPPTPAQAGYRMPGEWEPHQATWIAWPHNRDDWPGKFQSIPWIYADIVRHLAHGEQVRIVVNDAAHQRSAERVLRNAHVAFDNVEFFRWKTDRVWTRDSGPIFVTRAEKPQVAITHWQFNGWSKYPNHKKDERLPGLIAEKFGFHSWQPEMAVNGKSRRVVLEGGSIDVNGRGTMLTTEECLLSKIQQRNPGLSRDQLETFFAQYLGIKKTVWLGNGIAGDDTHGHVDDISRFVSPNTVLTAVEKNSSDPNHAPLQENLNQLKSATDQDGKRLNVIELPLPSPVWFRGQRLPASYANFYIANAVVLVPTFNDANDRVALSILKDCFPDREVVGIYCGDFIWGLGAIHCATQQQPAAMSRG
ncbi:MAG TPA: agmatine deiminase family protein [Terriglobales bacterium]|nr:agmatine deiminase family protein [Terriglobales bacterium]